MILYSLFIYLHSTSDLWNKIFTIKLPKRRSPSKFYFKLARDTYLQNHHRRLIVGTSFFKKIGFQKDTRNNIRQGDQSQRFIV